MKNIIIDKLIKLLINTLFRNFMKILNLKKIIFIKNFNNFYFYIYQ